MERQKARERERHREVERQRDRQRQREEREKSVLESGVESSLICSFRYVLQQAAQELAAVEAEPIDSDSDMDDNHYSPAPPEPDANSNDDSESTKVRISFLHRTGIVIVFVLVDTSASRRRGFSAFVHVKSRRQPAAPHRYRNENHASQTDHVQSPNGTARSQTQKTGSSGSLQPRRRRQQYASEEAKTRSFG
jgi:hypothetical protein